MGNIAGDCTELKDLLLNQGIMQNLLVISQLQYDSKCNTNFTRNDDVSGCPMFMYISMISTVSWVLSNLSRGSPPPTIEHLELILKGIISLMKLGINLNQNKHQIFLSSSGHFVNTKITNFIDEILSNLAWSASYLTSFENFAYENASNYIIKRLGESGVIKQFIELMDYDNKNMRHASNRVIGNILTGTDENTAKCLELGVLRKYHNVLTNYCALPFNQRSPDIPRMKQALNRERKEICWSISNIAAGPLQHKLLILKNDLFPVLCRYLMYATAEVQRETIWAISNVTCDSNKQIIDPLVKQYNVIECLTACLSNGHMKEKTLMVALECMQNILECGNEHLNEGDNNPYLVNFEEDGLLDWMEELIAYEDLDEVIFRKVNEIVNKYWNGNEASNQRNVLLDHTLEQRARETEHDDSSDSDSESHDGDVAQQDRDSDEDEDEDDDLMVVCNDNDKNNMIPSTYVCFKCKQVGKHYIMNCDQD